MLEETKQPTKVFISYSWDSDNHKDKVLSLANTLRDPWGIEADVDQYVKARPPYAPERGWDIWMENRIEWAEHVLIVCTKTYKRRFRGDEEPGIGRGVTWEGTIIRQELYNAQLRNTKFIPVVFSSDDLIHVPLILNGNDKYVIEDENSFRELCYRLRREPTLVIPDVASGQLPPLSRQTYVVPKDASAEPPPVHLDVAGTLPRVPLKNLQDCKPERIRFIKNVKDPNPDKWAYSLERMRQPESRTFELMWRASSHGAEYPKAGDLMILHQRAKVTHVVEFLDDEVRRTEVGFFRWVRSVWIAEGDWNHLPHQRDVLGFTPNYSDGNTHFLNSSNFSTFREAWSSLEEFQKHIFERLTQSNAVARSNGQADGEQLQQRLQALGLASQRSQPTQPLLLSKDFPELGTRGRIVGDLSASVPSSLSTDNLMSERGVDYTRLRDLLKAGQWKEADGETADRMCEVISRPKEDWLRVEDIQAFPCIDLYTIDQLWVKYSEGRFGFSVQKKIWQECGSPDKSNTDWVRFCEEVGWSEDGNMLDYKNLNFSSLALRGHLPARVVHKVQIITNRQVNLLVDSVWMGCCYIFSRVRTCRLSMD